MASATELADAFNAAFNEHDAAKIAEHLTEDVTYWEANLPEPLKGRQAVEAHLNENWEAFSDAHIKVVNRVVSGDWIADEGEWTATNTGPLKMGPDQTVPATGKATSAWFVAVAKVSGDKISDVRIYYDNMTALAPLGLMEPPGSQ